VQQINEAIERVEQALDEQLAPVLAERQAEYEAFAGSAMAIEVDSAEGREVADRLLGKVVREKDGLERVRRAGPGALNLISRKLNSKFKPLSAVLEHVEKHLKNQIASFTIAERQRQQVAFREAQARHVEGNHTAAAGALVAASEAKTETDAGTNVREVWTVQTVDSAKVPREWMIVDEKRIAAHARATPATADPAPIPGVVFIKTAITTKRRGR
jgi:hypothetical protein